MIAQKSIVKITGLSHRYTVNWAIRDINFEIPETGVLGLLGSNGAGKSTTMNILCGVLNQTAGDVLIDGINMRREPEKAKRLIGFLPQSAPLYLEFTIDEYLTYCAHLRQMDEKQIPRAVTEVKDKCGIAQYGNRLLRNLSGGYRQRVGIAQAIIHKPRLVVLDEATNGLDPNQIIEVRKLIREIAEERAIIFSSHILSEIQATCRDVIMIEEGRMVFADTMEAFNNFAAQESIIIKMEAPPSLQELGRIPGITKVELLGTNTYRMRFDGSPDISERVVRMSVEKGWRPVEVSREKSSLDEVFAQLSNKRKKSN
ncbi:MAG: ABC transporter ATP-binding protein [Bacteroidota bacterium]|nr:ABC transporter ATP-binding protein [Bacteroidota bacterium]MDP4217426.1 ABC transporter ATP-binding protein [Bacteroidota bacterium]MDP4246075.1 ABC transporter ATP-binding protein [Bacteroidota bacterium]MDP4253394.1 ABC transporter ATP-binding protein [Bacteroidota bacterium]MDP4259293.1 ABC transporter ATP-binding protein [Bacteroidota bacterium]